VKEFSEEEGMELFRLRECVGEWLGLFGMMLGLLGGVPGKARLFLLSVFGSSM